MLLILTVLFHSSSVATPSSPPVAVDGQDTQYTVTAQVDIEHAVPENLKSPLSIPPSPTISPGVEPSFTQISKPSEADITLPSLCEPVIETDSEHNDTTSIFLQTTLVDPQADLLFDVDDLLWPVTKPTVQASYASFSSSDFPHSPLPSEHPVISLRLQVLSEALADLQLIREGKSSPLFDADPVAFANSIIARLPNPSEFKAGGLTAMLPVWKQFFHDHKNRRTVRQVLKIVEDGLIMPMVSPFAPSQLEMPSYKQKLSRLQSMLQKSGCDPEEYLKESPLPVQFPNHKSAEVHAEFLESEIKKFVERGAVLPVTETPVIVHPVGVVVQRSKLRLILDPAYLNIFLKYFPFKYEQLLDLTTFLESEDWAYTSDDKAGYHHVPLHPSFWSYLGFQVNGKYFVFTHLPFGVGPACRIYTMMKDEIFRVLRSIGNIRMSFLIDDQIGFASNSHLALFQSMTVLRVLWALGFTVGWDKSAFFPVQRPQWLGMMVDIPALAFVIPDYKISEFQAMVAELSSKNSVSYRTLASLAGKLLSFCPALRLSRLYARVLYNCMKGVTTDWDKQMLTPAELLDTMTWLASQLPQWNGLSWAESRETLLMAGDYSSTHGYAAFTPYGELSTPIVISLTEEELAFIAANKFSSTKGELTAIFQALSVLTEQHPTLVVGKTFCYECDNQAAVAVLNGMKGNPRNFPIVRAIWELARSFNIDIRAVWFPRETAAQVEADRLSKIPDNSEWALHDSVFESKVLTAVAMFGKTITLDPFASTHNAKAARFFSKYWCPGSAGVDAFMHKWAVDEHGNKMFAYINGDFSRMGEIIQKILSDQVDCAIIYPLWPRFWQSMWQSLPVRFLEILPSSPNLCVAGPRVPKHKLRGKPHFSLALAVIIF